MTRGEDTNYDISNIYTIFDVNICARTDAC